MNEVTQEQLTAMARAFYESGRVRDGRSDKNFTWEKLSDSLREHYRIRMRDALSILDVPLGERLDRDELVTLMSDAWRESSQTSTDNAWERVADTVIGVLT